MKQYKLPVLFMCQLGCKPKGRNTEQHDFFFSIGDSITDILSDIREFWPEAAITKNFHIDSYRQVTLEGGYVLWVKDREESDKAFEHEWRAFFINLGGYKKDEFGEFHYTGLFIAANKADAIKMAKETAFFEHTGYEGARSHIDDEYGIDVDDVYEIQDLLPETLRKKYTIMIMKAVQDHPKDEIYSGFQKLTKFEEKK